jgi:hypothetical protein
MEKSQPKLKTGQIVKWKEQEFPSVYSNIMGFGLSAFDITLIFGEIGEATPTEVTGIPKAKVILVPEQAANLIKLLEIGLATYVQNNGALRTSGAVDMELLASQVEAQSVRSDE